MQGNAYDTLRGHPLATRQPDFSLLFDKWNATRDVSRFGASHGWLTAKQPRLAPKRLSKPERSL